MDDKYKNIGSIRIRLMEECSELIQIICKAERFGWENHHPEDIMKTPNFDLVHREMDDVYHCIEEMEKRIKEIRNNYYTKKESRDNED